MSGQYRGDHTWAMQTAPSGMGETGGNVGLAHIRGNDPGLVGVAGGSYSIRPRTPTRPSAAMSGLHIRRTVAYNANPTSSVVMTRNASPRALRHMRVQRNNTPVGQQSLNTVAAGAVPVTAGKTRIPVEHYINIMRDSVHRLGVAAMPLIDQLCFSSRRAQIDGLFRLCPSIDMVDSGKVIAYLQANSSEIEHLRTLTRGHGVIPAAHVKEPTKPETRSSSETAVQKKNVMRTKSALPVGAGVVDKNISGKLADLGTDSGLAAAAASSVRLRQLEAHTRTHAPVLQYGKNMTTPPVSNVQTIFSDLERVKTKFVGLGRHTSRPTYVDNKPSWSLVSRSSPMHPGDESERFKTVANSTLPAHMRPVFKYIHPAQLGETNNFTKLRNFKKFHTDIKKTLEHRAKERTGGRNAIHKPEFQFMNNSLRSSRRSDRTYNTNQGSSASGF